MRTVTAVAIVVVIIMIVIILFIMLETKVISTTTTTTTTGTSTGTSTNTSTGTGTSTGTSTNTGTSTGTSTSPQYDIVTIINPTNYTVQLIYHGEHGFSVAILEPNQSVTLTILNNTVVVVRVLVQRPTYAGYIYVYCNCYIFTVTGSGTITLDATQLDSCYFSCLQTGPTPGPTPVVYS